MWKNPRFLLHSCRSNLHQLWRRSFLSDSYSCQEIWDKRMTSPEFKSIKVANLHYELDLQFSHFAKAPPVEVDMLVNLVRSEDSMDEVQDILHKFRLSPETIDTLPSTHHGVIRYYLEVDHIKSLINILDDRLSYGIFPDDYLNNFLMDTFLKRKLYLEAAKVATNQALQETYDHPISKYMGIYSCLKYLNEPSDWHVHDPVPEPEPEDDVKVKVRFLINPYFDDHFDLRQPGDLIGKTFIFIGKGLKDPVGNSLILYGLVMRKKLEKAKGFADTLASGKEKVCGDVLTLVGEALNVEIAEAEKEEFEKKKSDLLESLKKIENQTVPETLISLVEGRLKDAVSKHEMNDIQNQCKLYDQWEKDRVHLYLELLEQRDRERRLAEVNNKLRELEEKEEELYYFQMKDKMEIQMEEKLKEIRKREEKLQAIRKAEAEEYIPPEMPRTIGTPNEAPKQLT
nr:PREDICTED: 28S ribosomal protein S27, mitochondrial [Bemisia tabaci]